MIPGEELVAAVQGREHWQLDGAAALYAPPRVASVVWVVPILSSTPHRERSAPPKEEPITGLLHDYPAAENLFFGIVLYGLAAAGCLLFPAALAGRRAAWLGLYWTWTISGLAFTLFSALNFYTHTGMLININNPGPDLRW